MSAIRRTRIEGGRLIAVGTTVVRALEHAAARTGLVRAGNGVADQRIGADSCLRIVDVILSGTHEPDSSHYQMLRAFVDDATLNEVSVQLEARGYRTHEFGDSVLIEKGARRAIVASRGIRFASCHRVLGFGMRGARTAAEISEVRGDLRPTLVSQGRRS